MGRYDKIAFEIGTKGGKVFRIFANGNTEGFEDVHYMANSIPTLIRNGMREGFKMGSQSPPLENIQVKEAE